MAVRVTRNGVIESEHLAHVLLSLKDGPAVAVTGDPNASVYPRSAFKPFQAVAVQEQLAGVGVTMEPTQLAMASASHDGNDVAQIFAADMLAHAGLDEDVLQCPAAWPADPTVRSQLAAPTRLSHNCSGKHAAMVWAHTASGDDPATYLDRGTQLQRRIATTLARVIGQPLAGPGVDGCGAPAWHCSLAGMALGFARLLSGSQPGLTLVRDAMMQLPHLVGGAALPDSQMMLADGRVVAKRGAEGVMVAAFFHPRHGPIGVAVKIVDGSDRAAGPLTAAVLRTMGAEVSDRTQRVPVLGGTDVVGSIQATSEIDQATVSALARLTVHYR